MKLDRRNRGEVVEYRLAYELMNRGLNVSKPLVPARYDLLVDNGNRFFRVQVKSTHTVSEGANGCFRYRLTAVRSACRSYLANEVDVIAAYVAPLETWYFIPHLAFRSKEGKTAIYLFPNVENSKGRFEPYRGAWEIFDFRPE